MSSCDLDSVFLGQDIPVNMHGDVDPDYWEQEILPTLQGRVDRLDRDEVVGFINIFFQDFYLILLKIILIRTG